MIRRTADAKHDPDSNGSTEPTEDVAAGKRLRSFELNEPAGTVLAIGADHVLSPYRHPKSIELSTGECSIRPELPSGLQDGSIVRGLERDAKLPPMALAILSGNWVTGVDRPCSQRLAMAVFSQSNISLGDQTGVCLPVPVTPLS
jgi:hypothetical protein